MQDLNQKPGGFTFPGTIGIEIPGVQSDSPNKYGFFELISKNEERL